MHHVTCAHISQLERDLAEFDDGDHVLRESIYRDIEYKTQNSACSFCRQEYGERLLLCHAINLGGTDEPHDEAGTFSASLRVILDRTATSFRLENESEASNLSHFGIDVIPTYDRMEHYEMKKRLDRAELCLKRELGARRRVFGNESICTVVLLTDLARVLQYRTDFKEAEHYQQQLVNILAKNLTNGRRRWAEAQMTLAVIVQSRGSLQRSADILRNVFSAQEQAQEVNHIPTLNAGLSLSWVLADLREYDEAQDVIERVRNGFRKQLGSEHSWTIQADFYQLRILRHRRCFDKAWEELNVLENKLVDVIKGNKLLKIRIALERANYHKDLDRLDEAKEAACEAWKTVGKLNLPDATEVKLAALRMLATICGKREERTEEEESLRKILDIEVRVHGDESPVWNTKHQLAACLKFQNREGEAFLLAGEVLNVSKLSVEKDPSSVIGCTIIQASVLQSHGSTREAADILQLLWETCKRGLGRDHLLTVTVGYHMASVVYNSADMEQAAEAYEDVLDSVLKKHHPAISPLVVMRLLETALRESGNHEKAQIYRDKISNWRD